MTNALFAVPDEGWYPDPVDPAGLRWWDGYAWTDETSTPIVPVQLAISPLIPEADTAADTLADIPTDNSAAIPAEIPVDVPVGDQAEIPAETPVHALSRRELRAKVGPLVSTGTADAPYPAAGSRSGHARSAVAEVQLRLVDDDWEEPAEPLDSFEIAGPETDAHSSVDQPVEPVAIPELVEPERVPSEPQVNPYPWTLTATPATMSAVATVEPAASSLFPRVEPDFDATLLGNAAPFSENEPIVETVDYAPLAHAWTVPAESTATHRGGSQTFAVWMLASSPLWGMAALIGAVILREYIDQILAYAAAGLLVLIICLLLATVDRGNLRDRGFEDPVSPGWALFPAGYLVVRAIRVGRDGIAPVIAFVLLQAGVLFLAFGPMSGLVLSAISDAAGASLIVR